MSSIIPSLSILIIWRCWGLTALWQIDPDRKKGLSELNDEKMCISIFKKPLLIILILCVFWIFIITVGALHFCADVCPSCDHIVASHEYTFRVEGQYQVFPELNNIISIPSHRKSSHLSQLSKQEQIISHSHPSHFILPIHPCHTSHPSHPSLPSHLSQPSQPCHPSWSSQSS